MAALRGTWIWIFSLTAWCFSAAQDQNSTTQSRLFERLSASLKEVEECGENLTSAWSARQTATLLLSMKSVTDLLHKHKLKACASPIKCPEVEVPRNGGLACGSVENKRFCKPMCNHGYDFDFMRRSRVFEECSERTGFKWETQYVGGNKLAVCNAAPFQVSGSASAYFAKDRDCLMTESQGLDSFMETLTAELKSPNDQGEPESLCLLCGSTS